MNKIILILIGLISSAAFSAELKIKVNGLQNKTGFLSVALYNSKENFLKDEKAFKKEYVTLSDFSGIIEFKSIPTGDYAVVMYHDENANKKLDTNFMHIPKEGYGVSLNPSLFGPPQFGKSVFNLKPDESKEIEIQIKY